MANNSDVPIQKDRNVLSEVDGVEKQLWTLNHTKGLLHSDALDLYRKVCAIYEKIFQSNNDLAKLYDAEYSLWKLHYRHIDEFRKRVKKTSADGLRTIAGKAKNPANLQISNENQTARFKSFLSEATEFYKKLLQSMRKQYEEASSEMKRMKTYHFLCHRFLVCLGDISRYREQYVILDIHLQNWSVSASHYLEAATIWPDSGNPHNQIAVLATYVGDVFLALYHCVRSLAVKEPFPDAWDNLILLFEKNSSSHLESFSRRVRFDFLKPSQKSSFLFKSHLDDDDCSNRIMETEDVNSFEANLWPLIVRMMSFFFLKFSLEEFLCTFACAMRWLEALMELDDRKLNIALESYSRIDSVKTGPFRAVQFVSVLIFMLQNVFNRPEVSGSKEMKDFALAGTFVCMGRLVDRCLKSNKLDSCPLLPAIVVFVEWFGGVSVKEENSGIDENSKSSMSYFFDLFVNLLKSLGFYTFEADSCRYIPLWEDYELRGFTPLASSHESPDFAAHSNRIDSFEGQAEDRAFRIINAAVKISNRLNGSRKWIIYDESERKFYTDKIKTQEKKELEKAKSNVSFLHQLHEDIKEYEEKINGDKCESPSFFCSTRNSAAVEEEEVILFKPLTRYNSAPPYTPHPSNGHSRPNNSDQTQTQTQTPPSDECLRRATSLLLAQNFNDFHGKKSDKNHEQFINDPAGGSHFSETYIPSGPPSLSAWVVNRVSSSNNKENGINSFSKHGLRPIEEMVPTVFDDLTLGDGSRQESETVRSCSSTLYLVPEPSAPLLPEDAVWYKGVDSHFSECATSGSTKKCDTFSTASHKIGNSNWMAMYRPSDYSPSISDFASPRQLTSSEWLRQYQHNQNIDRINRHLHPGLHSNDLSSRLFDHLGQWLNPSAHGATENRMVQPIPDYQRPGPYWRDAVTDARNEQVLLLQYLKEREWRLQQDPALRGPTYMGN